MELKNAGQEQGQVQGQAVSERVAGRRLVRVERRCMGGR